MKDPGKRCPAGPLRGLTVVEIGGIGPAPFAGMTLADLGADVIRIDRPGAGSDFPGSPREDLLNRGKRSIALNLKDPANVERVLTIVERADVLIEGFRPGVVERLGLGPDVCLARNPRLIFGRMTGWGQNGPLSNSAGHDLSYIAVTGALHAIGDHDGPPVIPLNLVGDYGGGGLYLVVGVLAALRELELSGCGQVVDAAIVDGVSHLLTGTHAMLATGTWADRRGENVLDGGAPYYAVYRTADGRYMAVAAIENQFYAALIERLGVTVDPAGQSDRTAWHQVRTIFAGAFASRTQQEWCEHFDGSDACVSPVLSLRDAAGNPHLKTRGTLLEHDGILQAAPAPRFSVSSDVPWRRPPLPGEDTTEILQEFSLE